MTPWVIPLPKNDRNDFYRLNNPKIRKRPVPLHYHLHNFMMTRVPSDYYRLQRPSLALQGDQLMIKKSKRENIRVEGNYFRYINNKNYFEDQPRSPEAAETPEPQH